MTPRELSKWRAERRRNERAGREAGPKAAIIKLLEERGIRFWRMNSGDTILKTGNRRARKIKGNVAGTPDLMIVLDGGFAHGALPIFKQIVWCEVKRSEGGKTSKEQVEFQAKAESLGETYLICRSAEELGKWLGDNL